MENDCDSIEDHFDKYTSLFATQTIRSTKLQDVYGNLEGRPGGEEPSRDLEVDIENDPPVGPPV